MRKLGMLACLTAAAMLAGSAMAQDGVDAAKRAQNKLLAQRAARVDAMRKLAEQVKGLHITSTTTVQDFVTQNDQINTAMQTFLLGAKEVGEAKYQEDGTCSVKMEVTLREVIATLKQISSRHIKGDHFKSTDFEEMTVTNKDTVISATGNGAPRPELEETGAVAVSAAADYTAIDFMSASAKTWWLANVTGQGRLMAIRGAQVDGLRKLGERIGGLMITSTTSVKDFVTESDAINTDMKAFIRGAKEVKVRYHDDEPIVEVTMQVTLRTIYATLKEFGSTHVKGDKVTMQKLEELSVRAEDTPITETGMSVVPPKYMKDAAAVAVSSQIPDWVKTSITAVGNGAIAESDNPAQAKLMAYRAAELDARRKLAEQIDGLMIGSSTSVKDFVTQNDDIRTSMLTFQQGAHVVEGSQKLAEDGTASVTVELELRPLWDVVTYWEKKLSIKVK